MRYPQAKNSENFAMPSLPSDDSPASPSAQSPTTRYLHIFRASSGQFSGKVLEEIAGISGCSSPVDVMDAARSQHLKLQDLPRSVLVESLEAECLFIPRQFHAFCESQGLTAKQVLSAFMADLAELESSNGSDERDLAFEWFDRVVWPEPADNLNEDDEDEDAEPAC